ncbi:U-actitoxin-Avd3l-like [Mustelus asterias]
MELQLFTVSCSILLLAPQFGIVQTGRCRASMPRFFYSRSTETCEQFTYGGCGGNRNKFLTLNGCTNFCGGVNMEYMRGKGNYPGSLAASENCDGPENTVSGKKRVLDQVPNLL